MNEQENIYKKFESNSNNNSSFGKSVLIPFVSGIIGASLVIGVCFGVPEFKNKFISSESTTLPTKTRMSFYQ